MNHDLKLNSALWVLVFCAAGCAGESEEPEEPTNLQCETSCIETYIDVAEACEQTNVDCYEDCRASGSVTCEGRCRDVENQCKWDLMACVGECPCEGESTEGSEDCSVEKSPYDCTRPCGSAKYTCEIDCGFLESGTPEFSDCRMECARVEKACVEGSL